MHTVLVYNAGCAYNDGSTHDPISLPGRLWPAATAHAVSEGAVGQSGRQAGTEEASQTGFRQGAERSAQRAGRNPPAVETGEGGRVLCPPGRARCIGWPAFGPEARAFAPR